MKANAEAIRRMTTAAGFGLAALTMLSVVLGWALTVQYALLALLVLVPSGLERVATRARRR